MEVNIIIETGRKLKQQTGDIMNRMVAFGKKYPKAGLPGPEPEFNLAKALMEKEQFCLAVCGKVKNGKTSLINAIIGRELLPVATDVATSRAFEIRNAREDSFFVVYANGDKKPIGKEDLARYGSQATIDDEGMVDADKTVAYIEVNTPVEMLPDGVVIIDTPGIGATYPQHTAITKKFLAMADAVLFVANPSPLEKIETDFLKEVADITPYILFVTTKVDEVGEEAAELAISANEKHINEAIGDKLPEEPRMLRMSSKQLLDASKQTDKASADFQLMISGYEDVRDAMLRLVYLTEGYYRTGNAYNAAVEYYQQVLKALKHRTEAAQEAAKNYDKLVEHYEESRHNFVEKLGDTRRKKVLENVEKILATLSADFAKMFSANGDIFKKYEDEIGKLDIDNVDSYKNGLGERVTTDLQQGWQHLTNIAQQRMNESLQEYNEECRMAMPRDIRIDGNEEGDPTLSTAKLRDSFMSMRSEMLMASMGISALGMLAQGAALVAPAVMAPLAPVLGPVFVVLGVGAVLWGAIGGSKRAKAEKLRKNKQEILAYVQETIVNCSRQISEVSLSDGKYESLYQGFCNAVRAQARQAVEAIYDKYHREIEAMHDTLAEAKTNPKVAQALAFMTKEWSLNKDALLGVKDGIEKMGDIRKDSEKK